MQKPVWALSLPKCPCCKGQAFFAPFYYKTMTNGGVCCRLQVKLYVFGGFWRLGSFLFFCVTFVTFVTYSKS